MRTQGLERGWLRLKRAATTQPFTRWHLPFKINSSNKRLFNPILYMFTQIYVQSPGSLSFIILQQTMYIIPSSAATSILKWMEWIFFKFLHSKQAYHPSSLIFPPILLS
jgi:hypothetical protein